MKKQNILNLFVVSGGTVIIGGLLLILFQLNYYGVASSPQFPTGDFNFPLDELAQTGSNEDQNMSFLNLEPAISVDGIAETDNKSEISNSESSPTSEEGYAISGQEQEEVVLTGKVNKIYTTSGIEFSITDSGNNIQSLELASGDNEDLEEQLTSAESEVTIAGYKNISEGGKEGGIFVKELKSQNGADQGVSDPNGNKFGIKDQAGSSDFNVSTEAKSGVQKMAVLMCKFYDYPTYEPHSQAWFDGMMNNSSYPGQNHYWKESSYGKISVSAKAYGWFRMSSRYDPSNIDPWGLFHDCVAKADPYVNFANYDYIILAFNKEWNVAYGGSVWYSTDGVSKRFGAAWLAKGFGYERPFVVSHELGHSFGLPHSGTKTYAYGSDWDVMSYGYSVDTQFKGDARYIGVDTISTYKYWLGWLDPTQVASFNYNTIPPTQKTYKLDFLGRKTGTGVKLIRIQHSTNPEDVITVEAREKSAYDKGIPSTGVILHVSKYSGKPAYIFDASGVTSVNSAGSALQPGDRYVDPYRKIVVYVSSSYGNGYYVNVNRGAPMGEFVGIDDYQLLSAIQDVPTTFQVTEYFTTVKKVEFYVNGSLAHTDSVSPFEFVWTDTSSDSMFLLEARASDNYGNVGSKQIVVFKGASYPVLTVLDDGVQLVEYDTSTQTLSGNITVNLVSGCDRLAGTYSAVVDNEIILYYELIDLTRTDTCSSNIVPRGANFSVVVRLPYDQLINPVFTTERKALN